MKNGGFILEIIFMFGVGFIVLIVALFAFIKIVTQRILNPKNEMNNRILKLEEKVCELEKNKK